MPETSTGHGPRISVVITCFNYARYVGGAIESALAQDYPAKEVIVVNDGSTDGSSKIIARYAPGVRAIDQPNQGWVASYNRGFAESTGDVIVFLDADDLLDDGALSAVAAAWRPSCAKVQYDLRVVDGDGADLGRRVCSFSDGYDAARVRDAFRSTGTYRWPVTVGNAYSRWFVDAVFPLVRHGPDGFLNTLAPLYGDVVTIPRALAAYRLHGSNGWSASADDVERLPERIRHRRDELSVLREHARRRGVALPSGDILDHELVFLNYRLIARRLGLSYPADNADDPGTLFYKALRLLATEDYTTRAALVHAAWFCAVTAAPAPLVRELVRLRFGRSQAKAALQRRVKGIRNALSMQQGSNVA